MAAHLDTADPTPAGSGERASQAAPRVRPRARWADDLLVAVLGAWGVIGSVLDSWAHANHRPDSFFTPWHGVLYSGTFAMVGCVAWVAWRRRVPGAGSGGLPAGYGLGLVGFALFLVGAVGDLTWHTTLGIEVNLDGAVSPTHLTLILAGFLLLGTPLRSAWAAPGRAPAAREFLPALLALLNVAVLLALVSNSLAAAWGELAPTVPMPQPAAPGTVDGLITQQGVLSVLVSNLLMLGLVLLALRRWRPPFGVVTLVFLAFAAAQLAIRDFATGWTLLAAALGGLSADLLVCLRGLDRRRRSLLVATVTPVVLWSAWLGVLAIDLGLTWTPALCSGTVMLAALSGLGLFVLVFPPPVPSPGQPA